MKRELLLVLVALAAVVSALPHAAAQQSAPAAAPSGASGTVPSVAVEQKRAMVERILRDSPLVVRVGASANDEAKRLLASAREVFGKAQGLIAGGHLVAADALLNEAIWQVGQARQLVPDPMSRGIGDRVRYQQLTESIAALRASYRVNVEREARRGRGDTTPDHDMAEAEALVDEAKSMAAAELVTEANRLLDQALALMLKDFQRHLGGHTLTYARKFSDPGEEYDFERERFRSYESLVPLALTEYRPNKDALLLVNRYVKLAGERRERAERMAAARNYGAATKSLQEATDSLQRALSAAGLSVPQTMATQ
jgi:hypothetical protein